MIYLDHHSTTPMSAAAVEAMVPWMRAAANPHSDHALGRSASDAIESSLHTVADLMGTQADRVLVTSGATESNNLAIRGVMTHRRQKRRRLVTLATEHPCVLEVAESLGPQFEVRLANVDAVGRVDLDHLAELCDDQTALVSIAAANNEIGVVADLPAIAAVVHRCGALLHSDATQHIGRRPLSIATDGIDLVSGSAHKFHGPMGCGFLVVGGADRRVRISPQIIGGGQQRGLRSGTMNVPAIVGMAAALSQVHATMADDRIRIRSLRNQLWDRLANHIDGLDEASINGPPLDSQDRLEANLNFARPSVEGEAWIVATPEVALSSGSACSHVDPAPSHVLTAIGRDESFARRSVRFGLGRDNTPGEVKIAADRLIESYHRLLGTFQSRSTGG